MYNILIVDDEKIERNGIRLLLKRMGADFNIAEASNGKEALDYINAKKDSQDAPDILLTDVKMPFMDGIELIKEVRNNNIHTKNIIFSGYNEFEYAKLAVRLGVVDYILKPVDPKEFENVIKRVTCELDSENMEKLTQSRRDDFIKEYLLYSMINGRNINAAKELAGEENYNQQYSDIGINGYDRLILIEFNGDFFGKEVVDFADDILKNICGSEDVQYLNLNQQQAVVFIREKANDVYEIAKGIHEVVFEQFGHRCYIAISEKLDNYNSLTETMDYLEQLMENKFYYPEVYIYTQDKRIRLSRSLLILMMIRL